MGSDKSTTTSATLAEVFVHDCLIDARHPQAWVQKTFTVRLEGREQNKRSFKFILETYNPEVLHVEGHCSVFRHLDGNWDYGESVFTVVFKAQPSETFHYTSWLTPDGVRVQQRVLVNVTRTAQDLGVADESIYIARINAWSTRQDGTLHHGVGMSKSEALGHLILMNPQLFSVMVIDTTDPDTGQ